MRRAELIGRLRSRRVYLPLAVVVVLIAALVVVGVASSSAGYRTVSKMITGTPEPGGQARRARHHALPARHDARAGGAAGAGIRRRQDRPGRHRADARRARLRRARLHRARLRRLRRTDPLRLAPLRGARRGRCCVDYLDSLPQVDRSKIAVAGSSYGGGLALLLAGHDPRIKAVAADITWNDLSHALFPNSGSNRSRRVQEALGRNAVRQRVRRHRPRRILDARPQRPASRRPATCRAAGSRPTCAPPTRTRRAPAARTPRCAR